MDINQEIQKQTDILIAEQLPAMVKAKATKMIDEILTDVFRSYSEMGKKIKEKIEKQLDVNLQEYDTVDYNHIVAKAINEQLTQQVNLQPILSLCKNAIGFIEAKKIKMSEIVDMFKESSMEDNNESQGSISLFIEYNSQYKWFDVSIDADSDVKENNCGISFLVSAERKTIFSFKSRSHWSDTGKLTPSKITQLSALEHKIFRLYSAQVEIEVDEDNCYAEWDRVG